MAFGYGAGKRFHGHAVVTDRARGRVRPDGWDREVTIGRGDFKGG